MNCSTSFSKLCRFLRSREFALILLTILIFFAILGVIIPQKNLDAVQYNHWVLDNSLLAKVTSFLSLDNIFFAWYFYFLSSLLFLNTLLCTIRQIKGLIKIKGNYFFPFSQSICQASFVMPDEDNTSKYFDRITQYFKAHRFKVSKNIEENREQYVFFKSQWAKWGIVVFHLGLLIIMGSVFYGKLTRMDGIAYMGVGQTFTDQPQEYFKLNHGWLYSENNHLDFQMTLQDLKVDYSKGYPEVGKLNLSFMDGAKDNFNYRGELLKDLNYQGVRIFRDNVGYAPALVFTDNKERIIYATLQELQTTFLTGNRVSYETTKDIPQLGLRFSLQFYPDAVVNGKSMHTKSPYPRNPALYLKIWQGNRLLYDGFAKTGDRIKLADNLFFSFPGYRNWISFRLIRDNSVTGIFTGFAVSLAGLALYYLLLPQKFLIMLEGTPGEETVKIYGYTDKFKEIFKEKFALTVEKISEELQQTEVAEDV